MMGCILPKFDIAQIVAELFVIMFGMGAGFLQNTSNNSNILIQFLSWVSPMHYACELMLRRILEGRSEVVKDQILGYFGYDYGNTTCVLILLGFWFGYTLFGWAALGPRGKD